MTKVPIPAENKQELSEENVVCRRLPNFKATQKIWGFFFSTDSDNSNDADAITRVLWTFMFRRTKKSREKGRDLTQSYDKSPYTYRKIQKATWQHKNATKIFDYTAIVNRLGTVSWSNNSHPTGVVKRVCERSTFRLTATAMKSKGHKFKDL